MVRRADYPQVLEHDEEAVIQFLDAGCLALPMSFQEGAAPRLEGQRTRKHDVGVLEHHGNALAAAHLVVVADYHKG